MSIAAFVSDLRKLDVRLSVKGQRLRLNAPKGVLTDSLRAQIAEHKQELLQFLSDYEQSATFFLRLSYGEQVATQRPCLSPKSDCGSWHS